MLYPQQVEKGIKMDHVQHVDSALGDTISDQVRTVSTSGRILKKILGSGKK